jgi:hypothetical protein
MTMSDFQRAQLVAFAVKEAGPKASLEQMKAICFCMRNRVRAGWHDGNWLRAIEEASESAAHDPDPVVVLNPDSRELQRLLREIDDIYFSNSDWGQSSDEGISMEASLTEEKHEKKYWCFLQRPMRPWFKENILDDRENHKSRTQMGLMIFIE